jgi:hypothetical protein
MVFKYGNKEEAKSLIAVNFPATAPEEKLNILLDTTLKLADTFIDSGIEDADLPALSGGSYPSTIVDAATFYAAAVALQSLFSGNEDENKKPKFYLDEAERFLSRYISKKTRELLEEENNPYSVSQSPVDREYL